MTFQAKNFVSIVASMINLVRTRSDNLTDFNVGSVNRTLLEANAQEIDELYQQMVAGLVSAVPVATYRTFQFALLLAVAAGGLVRVSVTPQATARLIPAGAAFAQGVTPATYVSRSDVTIAPGASYIDVPIVAVTPGVAGNLGAGVQFTMASPPEGFVSATNLIAFINGADDETEVQRKTRFNDFITTLARGTPAALIFGAKDKAFLLDPAGNVVERVVFAEVHEPWLDDPTQPVGWAQIYLHNGAGGTSPALVARSQTILYGYRDPLTGLRVPGYKSAGIRLDVLAATELPVNLTGTIYAALGSSSADLAGQATIVVAAYIGGLDIGQTFIVSRVVELVMEIPGVADFQLVGGPTNRAATIAQKFMPGVLSFTGA